MNFTADRKNRYTFVFSDIQNSVGDFCRTYGGNLPQIVKVEKGRKAKEKTVKKSQTFLVHKVCHEKRVAVDILMSKRKNHDKISVPLSHPARFCLADGGKESTDYTMEQILRIKPCPINVIASPRCHFHIQMPENRKLTKDHVLHLRETYEETYILGNPITETSVSDELVQIAGGPNLRIVTGLKGYRGKWSTYLQVVSKCLTSNLKTEDFQTYEEYDADFGGMSDSDSVRCDYITLSRDFNKKDSHKYEDLQKPIPQRCVYEITWDQSTGNPIMDTTQVSKNNHTTHNALRAERPLAEVCKSKDKTCTIDRGESKNNLYDVGWDPVTKRPILNGELLSTSGETQPPKVEISGPTRGDDRQQITENEDNRERLGSMPSPRLHRSQSSGILISGLPKPAPKKYSSLKRPNSDRHKVQNTHQLCPIQSENAMKLDSHSKDIYSKEKARERLLSLPTMSVSEVAFWMKTLNIKCANKFVEECIDGALLLDLSDDIFSSFGMSKIESIKLRKFIKEGYVPKP